MLDGHKLAIQLSQRKTAAPPAAADSRAALVAPGKAATTKLVVRNVAFEGTRRDVLGLFSPFGAVRSCRLPRKFDGTHRHAGCRQPLLLSIAGLSEHCIVRALMMCASSNSP